MSNDEYYPEWNEDNADDFELDNEPRFANEGVPWPRKGHPDWPREDSQKWGPHFVNTGVLPGRLLSDQQMVENRFPHAAEERAFAMMWDYHCNGSGGSTILAHILGAPTSFRDKGDQSITDLIKDKDDEKLVQMVAQSVIQWLGTNIGSHFVDSARKVGKRDKDRIEKAMEILDIGPYSTPKKLESSLKDEVRMRKEEKEFDRQEAIIGGTRKLDI